MAQTTRFLIISDTHDKWPYTTHPAPKADVLLHCGDLTQAGGLPSFQRMLHSLACAPAELKLVIAGNHDLDLDLDWVRLNTPEDVDDHETCTAYLRSLQPLGIYYLEEGTHHFTLQSGRTFSVYASPYTPEFNGYAFAYGEREDRFNAGLKKVEAGVDIVMTHGPPRIGSLEEEEEGEKAGYTLDVARDGAHVGCEKLARAIERVKPRLTCFGHVHEGRGVGRVVWDRGVKFEGGVVRGGEGRDDGEGTGTVAAVLPRRGDVRETVFVNAAVKEEGDGGFLVEMELGF